MSRKPSLGAIFGTIMLLLLVACFCGAYLYGAYGGEGK